ncbi:DNA polymerase IV [Thermodesulfobacteriota bacterium]
MILHIDMDAFYASVEQLDNPSLKGQPVIVGGSSKRGVVVAASYEARKYGVHSAMPSYRAKQKCPGAIFLPPRMKRYKELSNKIMSLLKEFSPLVEPVSIDEAYMDITGCEKLHGNIEEIGFLIKKKIKDAVRLTCSVGIAPNRFLAKIASDMDKPDGLYIIMPEEAMPFIETLPIHKVSGVGKKTLKKIHALGIKTLGDVKKYPEKTIMQYLGKFGHRLFELSECIDDTPVCPESAHKSVSAERTLPENTDDPMVLRKYLMNQADEVGRELRKLDVRARTITLKIKHADFKLVTRSTTIPLPTQSSEIIYKEAVKLLSDYNITQKVRLIGVGASGLLSGDVPVQMDLFKEGKNKTRYWEKVDKTVDTITKKFGKGIIKRATLTEKSED